MEIFDYCPMSNHIHYEISGGDRPELIPEFNRVFLSTLAKGINKYRGRHGPVWDGRYKATPILDREMFVDRVCYSLLNPHKAGLAESLEETPFASSLVETLTGEQPVATYEKRVKKNGKLVKEQQEIRVKLSVAPFLRHRRKDKRQAFWEKALRNHKSYTERKRSSTKLKTWLARPSTKRKKNEKRPLCFTSCTKNFKRYATYFKKVMNQYVRAAYKYVKGNVKVTFPRGTFPPSRLPHARISRKQLFECCYIGD